MLAALSRAPVSAPAGLCLANTGPLALASTSRRVDSSSGSSTCPDSITPGSASASAAASPTAAKSSNNASTSPGLAQCVATDAAGSPLQSNSATNDGFVSCRYQKAGTCEYFSPGGQFSSGSSTCPDGITPAGSSSSSGTNNVSKGSTPSNLAQCVAKDDAGSTLRSSSTTDDGFVMCKYQTAGTCEYFSPGGQFSSGSSTCPDSITPAISSASGASVGSFLADSASANSTSDAKDVGSRISQPVIIALLAVNGVFVVAILVAGSIWVLGRRPNKSSNLKGLYAKVDASRETAVPLTHGVAKGQYYDGKPKSVFEDDP